MRNYKEEFEKRVQWLKNKLSESGAKGFIYGNSGGKDCTLVSILCKAACENTLGVIMPCESRRNFNEDKDDAILAAEKFGIENITVDITGIKRAALDAINPVCELSSLALANVNPRLRMMTLYAIAQMKGLLVVGTGNRSERTMGYFTKWGDGGCDLNPISDLTVRETYEFLRYLDAPASIIEKAPSAGLWEGQTDEQEMGITYNEIDDYLLEGVATDEARDKIERAKKRSAHKLRMPALYEESL